MMPRRLAAGPGKVAMGLGLAGGSGLTREGRGSQERDEELAIGPNIEILYPDIQGEGIEQGELGAVV